MVVGRSIPPKLPTPTLEFILGLPTGQLSHSTCWVAPDCSCPSALGSKQVGRDEGENALEGV